MENRKQRVISRIIFVTPALAIFGIFLLIPILLSLYYSFFSWDGLNPMKFNGVQNFVAMFQDNLLMESVKHSFILTFWALLIQLPMGLILAVLLSSEKLLGRRLFKTVYFMPVILSTSVLGVLWGLIYEPNIGLLNNLLGALGLESLQHVWLGDQTTALGAIAAVVGWQYIGFYMILFLAGLQGVPDEIIEAADLDGASKFRVLWSIRIPLIRHVISFAVINCVVGSLKYFDLIYIMTSGGPNNSTEVIASVMFKQAFRFSDFGYASSISMLLFVMGLLFAFVLSKLFKSEPVQY